MTYFSRFYTTLTQRLFSFAYFRLMSSVHIITQKGLSIYLMEVFDNKMNTYLEGLTPEEFVRLESIRHPEKRLEFAASRYLRTSIFGLKPIFYNEFGSPYLDQQGFISLSHTKGLVAMAHSEQFNIGVDVESVREKARQLQSRFVHPSEKEYFDINSAREMSLLWSFKETLYKLTDREGVLFAKELIVRKEDTIYKGVIHHHHLSCEYELFYQSFGQYLITCNASKEKLLPVEHI